VANLWKEKKRVYGVGTQTQYREFHKFGQSFIAKLLLWLHSTGGIHKNDISSNQFIRKLQI